MSLARRFALIDRLECVALNTSTKSTEKMIHVTLSYSLNTSSPTSDDSSSAPALVWGALFKK